MKKLRIARAGYVLMSIVFYVAGIVCIALSYIPPMAICIISGIILVIYGIVKIIGYLSDDLYCLAFQHDLACGILLIVVGFIIIGCNTRMKNVLSPGLGLLILVDAVLKVQTSWDAKRFGLETWNRILLFSIIAGIFGAMLIARPFSGTQASHIINGCALLMEGAMNHLEILETVKIADRTVVSSKNKDNVEE